MKLLALSALCALAYSQTAPTGTRQGAQRMEITVERLDGGKWKAIDPGLVVAKNDRIRFRFRSNFPGYLYVTNLSTSGNSTLLFPREDTGSENHVSAGRDYMIPATQGSFRVDGPAGYDIVSWTVSPVRLSKPEGPPDPPSTNLEPRCNDAIFRARGQCVDSAAGPQASAPTATKDELLFIREKDSSVVSSPGPLKGPVVYQFYLAHR